MNEEIISSKEWKDIIKYATEAFKPDIQSFKQEKKTYLDYLIAIIENVQGNLENLNSNIDISLFFAFDFVKLIVL